MEPIRITPLSVAPHITTRTFSLSGTPLPEDIRSIIVEHFGEDNINPDELDIVYQYILSKSESGEIDDIKSTIEAVADRLAPDKKEMFAKVRDLAINEIKFSDPQAQIDMKRDIISKELPALERQAQETGDWRFYLRASDRREHLGEISDIEG